MGEFAVVVARQAWLVAGIVLCGTSLALGLGLLTPKRYVSEIALVPPRSSMSRASSLAGSASAALLPLESLGITAPEPALVGAILGSRSVMDAVIRKFDLMRVYRTRTMEHTRARLRAAVAINVDGKKNTVTVTVEDREPERARDIAAMYGDEANRIANHIDSSRAGHERLFLEKRLVEVGKELDQAEERLKLFEVQHGVVDVGEQARATIKAVASMRAELAAREVQLSYLGSFAGGDEQNLMRVRREIAGIKKQLERLEEGEPAAVAPVKGKPARPPVLAPIAKVPGLLLEFARLQRDVKIQLTVFELLTKQHELAKINEVRESSTTYLLDAAALPTYKSSPHYSQYVIVGFLASLAVALVVARWRDRMARDPAAGALLREIVAQFGKGSRGADRASPFAGRGPRPAEPREQGGVGARV